MGLGVFKETILQETLFLTERGYAPMPEASTDHSIAFLNKPAEGVRCAVEFHLKEYFSEPIREFGIYLWRDRLGNTPSNDSTYAPLMVSLHNLMWFGFGIRIFPEEKTIWEFENEQELRQEIAVARSFLLDYGLAWLEDPLSDTHWRKQT